MHRRRAEAALLKVLGFARRQAAAVVGWQATVVVLIGVAAGLPVGTAAGRVAWLLFAANVAVVPVEADHSIASDNPSWPEAGRLTVR